MNHTCRRWLLLARAQRPSQPSHDVSGSRSEGTAQLPAGVCWQRPKLSPMRRIETSVTVKPQSHATTAWPASYHATFSSVESLMGAALRLERGRPLIVYLSQVNTR